MNRRKFDDGGQKTEETYEGPLSYRVLQTEKQSSDVDRVDEDDFTEYDSSSDRNEDEYKDVQGIIDDEFQSSFDGFPKVPFKNSGGGKSGKKWKKNQPYDLRLNEAKIK